MISTELARIGEAKIPAGVLYGLSKGVIYPGGEIIDGKAGLWFKDIKQYLRLVKSLKQEGYPVSGIPDLYVDYLLDDPPEHIQDFNWTSVPAKPMHQQREALSKAIVEHNGRSLIAMPMGNGKTMVGIMFALHYGHRSLFIVTKSMMGKWCLEFSQWTGLPAPYKLKSTTSQVPGDRVVGTYDMIKCNPNILNARWDAIVVDECHQIKEDSQRTRAILPLLHKTPAVMLLSATPVKSRPSELFNAFRALHPRTFKEREVFSERYAYRYENPWGEWVETRERRPEELSILLSKCMYRYDGITLPPLTRTLVQVEAEKEDLQVLVAHQEERELILRKQKETTEPIQLKRLGDKLKQQFGVQWRSAGMIKTRVIRPWVQNLVTQIHPGEKVVVFMHHIEVGKAMAEILSEYGPTVFLTGSTAQDKRDAAIKDFATGPTRFGVLSMEAFKEGIDLVPDVSVAVFMELSSVPATMTQAEGRIHRKGAIRAVSTYWIILAESIDPSILAMLKRKHEVTGEILDAKRCKFEFKH